MTLGCIQCGSRYEVRDWAAKHTHFCEACRESRDRVKARERMRGLRQVVSERAVSVTLPEYLEATLDSEIESFISEEDQRPSIMPDRQPQGWLSPYGSEEGRSSYSRDLREDLEILSICAASDPWWGENPHWCAPLHVDMPEKPPSAACKDARGSQKGYQRHVRAAESACDECLEAQAAYYREYRSKRISG